MKKFIKILKEDSIDLGEKTSTEKGIAKAIKKQFDFSDVDNFHDIVVDIYDDKYGKYCQITVLMERPFKREEADEIYEKSFEMRKFVNSILPNYFNGGVSTSTTTLDIYKEKHIPYYIDVKNKDVVHEDISRIKQVMGLTEGDKNISKARRRLSHLDFSINQRIDLSLIKGEHAKEFCKRFNKDTYLDMIVEDVIQRLYHSTFYNLDDDSKEWSDIYEYLEVNIIKEYGDKIMNAYIKKCKQ